MSSGSLFPFIVRPKEGRRVKRIDVENLVSSWVEEIIAGTELELVDVEYVRERDWYLRVYLDKPGHIDLDDCQKVSEQLSARLDKEDPIAENYLLEVSSPGLDRVLKKEKDFIRYKGRDVDVQLFKPIDGKKLFVGALGPVTEDEVTLIIDGQKKVIERTAVAQIRLHLDF